MSATNHLGHQVEQFISSHGWLPLNAQPHATEAAANDELMALKNEPGERRVFEALELHPAEATRVAIGRLALLKSLEIKL